MSKRLAYYDGSTATTVRGKRENLDKPSKDNAAMRPYWTKVATILAGHEAMKLAKETYLPKFPGETTERYDFRLSLTKFTNVFADVLEGLAARPFEAPVELDETGDGAGAPDEIVTFCENVDGAGNNLTGFASETFFNGIGDAIDWIFVDYPNAPTPAERARSRAEEAALGLRPFWSHVRAINVLEAKSTVVSGREMITYMRLYEPSEAYNDVREMKLENGVATWELWRQEKLAGVGNNTNGNATTVWEFVDNGVFSIGEIPLVPFITGRRDGRRWYFRPPMKAAADVQIELYQEESGLKHISTLGAFPVYAGNGVSPAKNPDGSIIPLTVGPSSAIYAPPDGKGASGTWTLLEPSASSLTFLQARVTDTIQQLRELGRNPLTAQSGNVTVITSAVASKKANSAVQMWAFGLGDALENALRLTALWMGMQDYKPEVIVFTDFDVSIDGTEDFAQLIEMRKNGDLSQKTLWKEAGRRGKLAPDFDADDEAKEILDEGPKDNGSGLDELGNPITPTIPGKPPVKTPAKPPANPAK